MEEVNAKINCMRKETTVASEIKNDPPKDIVTLLQVPSEELMKRRINIYPYLI